MANRVSRFHLIDWKSILGTALVLIVIGIYLSFHRLPDLLKSQRSKSYQAKTEAHVNGIKTNYIVQQTQFGNRNLVYSFNVSFSFEHKGKVYSKVAVVMNTHNHSSILTDILTDIMNSDSLMTVHFNSENPDESILVLAE